MRSDLRFLCKYIHAASVHKNRPFCDILYGIPPLPPKAQSVTPSIIKQFNLFLLLPLSDAAYLWYPEIAQVHHI